RWPTWMWANEEVVDFTRWLRTHNTGVDESQRAGFHGLDVYSLWESLRETLTYLREHDPEQVPAALAAYRCFEPYGEDAQEDARATDMAEAGEVNIGQLARERYDAERVVLVGFATHRGTVVASDAWGAPMRVLAVPPARRHSLEDVMHTSAPAQALFVFPQADRPDVLTDQLDHRAIGVVYHPDREKYGNYVPTVLGNRYDAFCWFDQSQAVRPLHLRTADTL